MESGPGKVTRIDAELYFQVINTLKSSKFSRVTSWILHCCILFLFYLFIFFCRNGLEIYLLDFFHNILFEVWIFFINFPHNLIFYRILLCNIKLDIQDVATARLKTIVFFNFKEKRFEIRKAAYRNLQTCSYLRRLLNLFRVLQKSWCYLFILRFIF